MDLQTNNVDKIKDVFLHPYFFDYVESNLKYVKYVCRR
ncbi:hypothetical protein Flavo103_45130 [Flavobacterium collinsii]|nr:hypothetical protein Flavo103_45130 [Flavobacterium collinsii]